MRWCLLAALLLLVPPAWAQAPAPAPTPAGTAALPQVEPSGMQARVEPERVLLGEPFTYELVLTHPADQRYELALPQELGDFELLEQSRTPPKAGQDPAVTVFRLKLSAFQLGMVALPNVPFLVSTPEGPKRYVAPGRTIEVGSSLPEDAQAKGADLKDIQPPTEVAIRSWRLLWGLLGLLAAAGLGYAAYRLFQKYRARQLAAPPEPPAPLDVRTRRALDALKSEDLPAQGRVKDFYVRLSEVVRGYLGERYGFDALECTSSELMARLRRMPTPGLPEDSLARFVSESDLVKYAKAESSPEACGAALAFGYELLDKTWSPPPPATPGAPVSHASGPHVP